MSVTGSSGSRMSRASYAAEGRLWGVHSGVCFVEPDRPSQHIGIRVQHFRGDLEQIAQTQVLHALMLGQQV